MLIIFTKLSIYISYYHYKDDDDLKIELRAWFGLIKYKIKIPAIKVDDNSPSIVVENESGTGGKKVGQLTADGMLNHMKNYKEILRHVVQLHSIVRKFCKKVSVKQFDWHSVVGAGDAAYTGMVTGAIWAVKGGIIGILSHYFRVLEIPKIMVTPNFNHAITQTRLICIFQFRIGNAMLVGIRLLKFWKGGRPHLKPNKRMSNEKTKSV
jgi:hypothetical protein